MILEFIRNSLIRYEMAKMMTNNVYYKLPWIRNEINILSTDDVDLTTTQDRHSAKER